MSPAFALVITFGALLFPVVWVATGAWVVLDARARGSAHPFLWGVLAPLSGILLLYYMLWWRRGHAREADPSRWERRAAVVALAGFGGLIGSIAASPADPVVQMLAWPVVFVCCLPVASRLI
ncbi:hypothetical protein SAMN04488066_11094 [Halorubrum aquaticum]|uniref:Uncharacterized protein n=2 Tax=Halorubrum TaxID=56688 RepID=A0A521CHC5_9EURY|nr:MULTISPECIES: hypothetical protein [Halorubrum]SFH58733.1 hypothetical protein SAMN04488066_11094 [Halorubrum aquaticum]SMO58863.1 hypothetical protein SAMN06264867_104207 [Halorubrum cibi]